MPYGGGVRSSYIAVGIKYQKIECERGRRQKELAPGEAWVAEYMVSCIPL